MCFIRHCVAAVVIFLYLTVLLDFVFMCTLQLLLSGFFKQSSYVQHTITRRFTIVHLCKPQLQYFIFDITMRVYPYLHASVRPNPVNHICLCLLYQTHHQLPPDTQPTCTHKNHIDILNLPLQLSLYFSIHRFSMYSLHSLTLCMHI